MTIYGDDTTKLTYRGAALNL